LDSRARSPAHSQEARLLSMSSPLGARIAVPALTVLLLSCNANVAATTTAAQAAPAPRAPVAPQQAIPFGDSGGAQKLEPFFPGTTYDPAVPAPDSLLRQPLGTFTAHHAEILAAIRAMEAKSPRMKVISTGRTHEGRELVAVAIALP